MAKIDPLGLALIGFAAYMVVRGMEKKITAPIANHAKTLPPYPIGQPGTSHNIFIQRALNQVFPDANLAVDGIIGPQTRKYVIKFQQIWGLTPDGIVGAQTEYALKAATGTPGYLERDYQVVTQTGGVPIYEGEY